ncbi:hypothetical protein KUL25_15665 [Rhodobacteraceae bacterium N5(2021)]|uniref:DUF1400 domain-containing protein n=1 Tax=Gymnodinialimonas phycosphaerae TaxID=2841589 RepID=A0A975YF04_9RHOB|nr:hypothetical protein [Gymnodinialimonas phycosphaerae]MBY4894195.1 hypothetical protein [Gymnodinialimonas phycosphaerae]
MVVLTMLRRLALSMALVFTVLPAWAHEVRPTIADVEVGQDQVTLSMRATLEALISGIDLSAVNNTNDAPESVIYDRLRAMQPAELEAELRAAWSRIARGVIIEVDGERLTPEIISVQIPGVGDPELPRDSLLTVGATLPEGDAGVQVGLSAQFGTFVPRQIGAGDEAYEGFLNGGQLTPVLPRAQPEGLFQRLLGAIGLGGE